MKLSRSIRRWAPFVAAGAIAMSIIALTGTRPSTAATTSSFWNSSVVPAVTAANDSSAVEVALRFEATQNGYISGIQFYKGLGNTGTHVASLWTNGRKLLATGTFTNETSTGWQSMTFSSPVPVSKNQYYVAGYYAPYGHYAYTYDYFNNYSVTAPGLYAPPSNSKAGYNGVYAYSLQYPTNGYRSMNYWVDVSFETSLLSSAVTSTTAAPTTTAPTTTLAPTTTTLAPTTTVAPTTTTTVSSSSGTLPAGVSLTDADGGSSYYGNWSNSFSSSPSYFPIGIFPAEVAPGTLAAQGINFFTPMRDDNAGTWCPTMTNPNGNDMTHVDNAPSFYSGAAFYGSWGNRAAYNVFGDELDGNSNNWFNCTPSSVSSNNQAGSWGGLSASAFVAANNASISADPTRPTYDQVTTTFMDGGANYHYTLAQKQAICSSAGLFSFDIYPIVKRGEPDYYMYNQVQEARGYCQDQRPVLPMVEMDHMDGGSIYPTPAQTTAEVWNAIIGGARGFQYFDQYGNVPNSSYTGGGTYAAGAMYNAIKAVDSEVESVAPVLNSPFATGYESNTGTMSVMTKYYNGHFYIFAIPHASGSQTVTFQVVGAASTATVVGENRSIPVSGGSFTDTFANQDTVHIYEIS